MSKGLDALYHPRIKSAQVDISAEGKHDIAYMYFDDTKQYAAIENELKDKEKQDKALEIIKNRKVDIYLLEITKNVDQYNKPFGEHLVSLCRLLTQEEYDLLKEVLAQ